MEQYGQDTQTRFYLSASRNGKNSDKMMEEVMLPFQLA